MHPLKARILEYEKQYGFNLQARRAFNNMLRGGGFKDLKDWITKLFHRTPSAPSPSSLVPSGPQQTTMNIKRKRDDETEHTENPMDKRTRASNSSINTSRPSPDQCVDLTGTNKLIDLSGTETTSSSSPKQSIIDLTNSDRRDAEATSSSFSSASGLAKPNSQALSSSFSLTSSLVTRRPKNVPKSKEWREAYCKYKVMLAKANPNALVDSWYVEEIQKKGERVNFVFDCVDNDGEGDCFLYAWLIADQLYGKNHLDQFWKVCEVDPDPKINSNTTKGKMLCLRKKLGTQLRVIQQRQQTNITDQNIKIIKTPGSWLRSQEIELIAKYFNMHFLIYCEHGEHDKSWQEFDKFEQDVGDTQSPTYYIYNTGDVKNGYAGNHFMTLVPIRAGKFSC